MPFEPATDLVKFARGTQLEAWNFLHAIQPEVPFTGLLDAYPVDDPLEPAPMALDQEPLSHGPINPRAICPRTGRAMQLRIYRDLSAVIVRETQSGQLEVLPAALTLPSSIFGAGFRDIPYHERGARASDLRLQGRPDGLHWEIHNATLTAADLEELLARSVQDTARIILEGGPVADPRHHADPPAGARFAPHARFAAIKDGHPRLEFFSELLRALGTLRSEATGSLCHDITIMRTLPDEPWRPAEIRASNWCHKHKERDRATRDRDLDKLLRNLIQDPQFGPPACYRHGPESALLVRHARLYPPSSNHEAMLHRHTLHALPDRYKIAPLLDGLKGAS